MQRRPKKRLLIVVNGILTAAGDAEGWTDRAVVWVFRACASRGTPLELVADKFEYTSGALTRRWGQAKRGRQLAARVRDLASAGWEVDLAGHSNGCDIIARALPLIPLGGVHTLHLLAGAVEAGPIAEAIRLVQVQHVHLHVAGRDRALQLARWSRRLLGWAGLGYGSLGREAEARAFAAVHEDSCTVHVYPEFGHGDFFAEEHFEATMRSITGLPCTSTNPHRIEPGPRGRGFGVSFS